MMERMNPPNRLKTSWEPFIFGTLVGVHAWRSPNNTDYFGVST
jgi:hypothetical protein